MRNPFPHIGKVIKYEFKHSARTLLPLYGVLLALGLLTGLTINSNRAEQILKQSTSGIGYTYEAVGPEAARTIVSGLLSFAVTALIITVSIITLVIIAKRFKTSMLGEEAYLNLSLPVTMGEHLWGRFIMDFLWFLICGVVIVLTIILCFIKMNIFNVIAELFNSIPELNTELAEQNLSFSGVMWLSALASIAATIWLITFIFTVNSINHLFKNSKGFVKFLIVIVLLFLYDKVLRLIAGCFTSDVNTILENWGPQFIKSMILITVYNLTVAAANFGFTNFVFDKKLNLE